MARIRSTIARTIFLVGILLFNAVSEVWATEHDCCGGAKPCCLMVGPAAGCASCTAPKMLGALSEQHLKTLAPLGFAAAPASYYPLHIHPIWRPPTATSAT